MDNTPAPDFLDDLLYFVIAGNIKYLLEQCHPVVISSLMNKRHDSFPRHVTAENQYVSLVKFYTPVRNKSEGQVRQARKVLEYSRC